jgi:hypothetical protein
MHRRWCQHDRISNALYIGLLPASHETEAEQSTVANLGVLLGGWVRNYKTGVYLEAQRQTQVLRQSMGITCWCWE